jgi:1-acyl-sn-glycerol-3-phosphate acyltransferase
MNDLILDKTSHNHAYSHEKFAGRRRVLRWLLDNIGFRFLAKLERVEGLEYLPGRGPAILMMNHIAFIDPVVVLGSMPRNIVPMAKAEVFRYPLWGIFPWIWHVIPVHRGDIDRRALRSAFDVLAAGEVLLIAPEGTRNTELRRGKEGVAYIGYRSGAPIIPVAVGGTSGFPTLNPERWRKPGGVVRLGKPFRFKPGPRRLRRELLRQMTDEAMYVLARMLPEERRGVYADLENATQETIEFLCPNESHV